MRGRVFTAGVHSHLEEIDKKSAPAELAWWANIGTLWLLAAPLCALIYCLLQPIAPNDMWYHVRAGWYISTQGSIPTTNLFSAGVPLDTPYHYQSWIAEWLMYQAVNLGLEYAALLRSLCVAVTLSLVVLAAYRRAVRMGYQKLVAARGSALGGLVSFLIFSNNVDLRPQTFSMVLFGVALFLLLEWPGSSPRRQSVLAGSLLFLFLLWVNTHGAFPVALVFLACCALGELVGRKRPTLLLVLVACCLVLLVNPRGPGIFGYLSMFNQLPLRGAIGEWQRPHLAEWHSALFLLCPLLLLVLLILRGRRSNRDQPTGQGAPIPASFGPAGLTTGEWLAGVALFALGNTAVRAMIWFALWLGFALAIQLLPLLKSQDAGVKDAGARPASAQAPLALVKVLNLLLLGLMLMAPLAFLPRVKTMWPWPPEFQRRFAPTPQQGPWGFAGQPALLLEDTTPVEATEYLRQNPPSGKLFCEMVYGSYLTWALYPHTLPLADPRVELFPTAFWEDYLEICQARKGGESLLRQRGFTDVLLDEDLQRPLLQQIQKSPFWELKSHQRKSWLFRVKNPEKGP